jgi:hypothetical protein
MTRFVESGLRPLQDAKAEPPSPPCTGWVVFTPDVLSMRKGGGGYNAYSNTAIPEQFYRMAVDDEPYVVVRYAGGGACSTYLVYVQDDAVLFSKEGAIAVANKVGGGVATWAALHQVWHSPVINDATAADHFRKFFNKVKD